MNHTSANDPHRKGASDPGARQRVARVVGKRMHWSRRSSGALRTQLIIGLLFAMLLSLMTNNSAQAALTGTSATFSGGATSTVTYPGQTIPVQIS